MVKFGFKKGFQRYQCRVCKRTRSDIPENPLVNLRVPLEKAVQVVALLCEGTGVRACERLTGLNRRTVLNILEIAGQKASALLDQQIRNVEVEAVECDELYSFTACKEYNNSLNDPEKGTQFTYLAVDRKSKLILSHLVGKRDRVFADAFMVDLRNRIKGRTQLTTDGYQGYLAAVYNAFGSNVDFARQSKTYADYPSDRPVNHRRYSPRQGCTSVRTWTHIGNPNRDLISTSHVERTNLSLRLFNRRFTRLTLGYSKKLQNLKHSMALFIAHFNFCRVHSAHKMTPAMNAELTNHVWTIEELFYQPAGAT